MNNICLTDDLINNIRKKSISDVIYMLNLIINWLLNYFLPLDYNCTYFCRCYAYVGNIASNPQILHMASSCFSTVSIEYQIQYYLNGEIIC